MGIQILTILGWLPTRANVLLRSHYYQRARLIREDADRIYLESLAQRIRPAAGPRRVSYVVQNPRPIDPDALQKSLFDALVKSGLLLDDGPATLTIGTIEYQRGLRSISIVLTDLEPAIQVEDSPVADKPKKTSGTKSTGTKKVTEGGAKPAKTKPPKKGAKPAA